MNKVVDLRQAKKAAERKAYGALVLRTFDDSKHSETRQTKELAAEVNRKARERL